jgi:short-subunit dehydrogenase
MRALITWASSWFGEEFAKQLAKKWYDLILVARSTDKLERLSLELSKKYNIKATYFIADLSTFEWIKNLCDKVIEKEEIDLLINNAGKWDLNGFLSSSLEELESMMILNMGSATFQSHSMINKWIREQKSGKIINVASIASFLFDWTFPLYSATKAFMRSISYWLDSIVEDARMSDKIKIQCLCPWLSKTHFFADEITEKEMENLGFMEANMVVKESLEALEKNEFLVIPWVENRVTIEYYKSVDPFEIRKWTKQLIKNYNLHF